MLIRHRGECAQIYGVNMGHNGEPVDADANSVKITITAPDNTVIIDSQNMGKIPGTTGEYIYNYDVPSDAFFGVYQVKVVFTTEGHSEDEFSSFEVKPI